MSFSSDVKGELLNKEIDNDCCGFAFLAGVINTIGSLEISHGGFSFSLRTEQIPRNTCDKITPELPLAPLKAPLDIASVIRLILLELHNFNSLTADCIVRDMLVPVSPSGTGKTFNASILVLFASSNFDAVITILVKSAPLILFCIKKISPN